MKSMDERRAAIKKQLRGGKRNTLRELATVLHINSCMSIVT